MRSALWARGSDFWRGRAHDAAAARRRHRGLPGLAFRAFGENGWGSQKEVG